MITFSNIGNMGRLANQMFQFASTVGIARRNGHDVKFPIENFKTDTPDSYSGCKLLECFDIPGDYLVDSGVLSKNIKYIYEEKDFRYNEETENIPDFTALNGYFQSDKYFRDYRKDILNIFSFRDEIKKIANDVLDVNGECISIHVRRGDYLQSQDYHPTQDVSYYLDAIKHFPSDINFLVFSDDIEWCKENFTEKSFIFIDSKNPYVDLYLMTKCSGHIISNSSFSWWGAWLSESDNKKIISPKKWFGPAINKNPDDIYCEWWIRI